MNEYSNRTAVLLVNVGTPDEPTISSVRRYLYSFLNDRRVIDLPLILHKLLVNLIIVPFRAPKSVRLYKLLWTPEGSPLKVFSEKSRQALQEVLGAEYTVFMAMRYANPSLKQVLHQIRDGRFSRLVVLPLFPQYASSTTGTAAGYVLRELSRWTVIPEVRLVGPFYDHPLFLEAFTERIRSYNPLQWDHLIFSYHGLPLRQLRHVHPGVSAAGCSCSRTMPAQGRFCYRAACYETSRQLASRLGMKEDQYSVAFQSRLNKDWLEPFTDAVLIRKAREGCRRILVAAPAFVADCLETTVEIGMEYQKLFEGHGGEKIQLVESLNAHPLWIKTQEKLILNA
ncbi:MAG: ferrochelatase [Mangrovibacterium sp.]